MNKAKTGKAGARSKKTSPALGKPLEKVDLAVIREQITNLVGNRALDMVEFTMKEVKKGHYLAMKYLFEMVGLWPATATEVTVEESSLAKTLLQRLKLPEEINSGTEVTKDSVVDPVEQESDAVK
jgi:hypothetical protein